MKKHHCIIILITFAIYGFIFYQKYHAGPDVNNYFRDNGESFAYFLENPDGIISKTSLIFADLNSDGIGDHEFGDDFFIYFNKDKNIFNLNCASDNVEIKGVIQRSNNEFYYYSKIESIYGYNDGKTNSENKGEKLLCFPN